MSDEQMDPGERALRARIAAHTMHARNDPEAITARARARFLAKFEELADPEGVLSPEDRAQRAMHLRKAYFTRLALASGKARRRRATANGGEAAPPPPSS
jgi:hypothetical protein